MSEIPFRIRIKLLLVDHAHLYVSSSLMVACESGFPMKNSVKVFDLLGQYVDIEDPLEYDYATHYMFLKQPDSLSWLLRRSGSSYKTRSTADCVQFAIKLLSDHDSHDQGSTVRLLLTGRKLDYTVSTVSDENGNTLLSRLAWQLGEYYGNCYISKSSLAVQIAMKSGSSRRPKPVKLLTLMLELIKGGSNLNSLFEAGGIYRTPLLEIICGGLNDHSNVYISLKAWLELLRRAGTDLERYGRDEKQLHLRLNVEKDWTILDWAQNPNHYTKNVRLLSFVYGPAPADWQFWFTRSLEPWFLEFWDMVEHPERAMPCAWQNFDDDLTFGVGIKHWNKQDNSTQRILKVGSD